MATDLTQKFDPKVPIGRLSPSDRNPNKGDVGAIESSIDVNGFYGAVIAQYGTGRVIVGHHRLRAAEAAGMATVPVLYIDVDDRTADRIMLADNRTAELADTDRDVLTDLLRDIATEDGTLLGTGFDDSMIEGLLGKFEPAGALDQPRLDQTKIVECPQCGHEWAPN